jgi:hypothetical protein
MMSLFDAFTITYAPGQQAMIKGLPAGQTLDTKSKEPCWFAKSVEVAVKYGTRDDPTNNKIQLVKVTSNKTLKLININSWLFKYHFLDQLNLAYEGEEVYDQTKMIEKQLSMIGMGLPNDKMCATLINRFVEPHNRVPCDYDAFVKRHIAEQSTTYFGHRYSNYETDLKMVEKLIEIYGDSFDGYVLPYTVCSCWMKYFAPEICLFDASKSDLVVLEQYPVSRKKSGGSVSRQDTRNDLNPYFLEEQRKKHAMPKSDWVKSCNESKFIMISGCGYTDEELRYDENGILILPSWQERTARRDAIAERIFLEEHNIVPIKMKQPKGKSKAREKTASSA